MRRLEADLSEMASSVTELGELVSDMLENAVKALVNSDVPLAEEVIDKYDRVAYLEGLIEEESLRILTL